MTDKKLTYCKDCKCVVLCGDDYDHKIDEYQHEDGSWYYSCGTCIQSGQCGVLGSIIHWCNDMMGMFSGESKLPNDEDLIKILITKETNGENKS